MLIELQRDLKMVGVNATKVEKINEMVYGEIKAVGMTVLSTQNKGTEYQIDIRLIYQPHTDILFCIAGCSETTNPPSKYRPYCICL